MLADGVGVDVEQDVFLGVGDGGYALLELLKNWEDIFVRIETKKFNKTSVYYFIREYTMLSAKEVRDAMKRYKNLYFFAKQKVIEE